MYNETIKNLLLKMEALPIPIVILYLRKVCGISKEQAQQAIYAACRAKIAHEDNGYLLLKKYVRPNSSHKNKAKALRVVLNFYPNGQDFTITPAPWIMNFTIKTGETAGEVKLIQLCHIERGMEMISSMRIAEKPIPIEDRSYIGRIALLDAGCDRSKIKAAGFSYFCWVDDNYGLNISDKISDEEAWADVPDGR